MKVAFVPIFITAIVLSACGPAVPPTPTLPAMPTATTAPSTNTPISLAGLLVVPTREPPQPTRTPYTVDEIYPTATFSSTFTPLPPIVDIQSVHLTSIHMMDISGGWGIEAGGFGVEGGGHILHTRDGAATWEDVTPPQGSYMDRGFFALDANTAWASPFGTNNRCIKDGWYTYCRQTQTHVWSTHDGGQTWTPSEPICIDASCDDFGASNSEWIFPRSIRFIDADNGWLLVTINYYMNQDRYKIYRTEDGGGTWKFVTSSWLDDTWTGSATGVEPLDLEQVLLTTNELNGAMDVHNDLRYFTSGTGAGNWEWVNLPLPTNPISDPIWEELRCGIESIDSLHPLVIDMNEICHTVNEKYEPIDYFVHFHSTDGAKTWRYWQQTGDVDFIEAMTGWQLTANHDTTFDLEQTHDGGLTWTKINTMDWEGQLNFVNEETGWALARKGNTVSVVHTTDGGRTWTVRTQVELTPTPTPTYTPVP